MIFSSRGNPVDVRQIMLTQTELGWHGVVEMMTEEQTADMASISGHSLGSLLAHIWADCNGNLSHEEHVYYLYPGVEDFSTLRPPSLVSRSNTAMVGRHPLVDAPPERMRG